jgi:hypothetical protein
VIRLNVRLARHDRPEASGKPDERERRPSSDQTTHHTRIRDRDVHSATLATVFRRIHRSDLAADDLPYGAVFMAE